MKRASQLVKIYKAANTTPGDTGAWSEITSVTLARLEFKTGATPSVATLREMPDLTGSFKSEAVPPNTATVETGDGNDGTLPTGADIGPDNLIRIDINEMGDAATYNTVFYGVVVDTVFDLGTMRMTHTVQDYRYFLSKIPVYGRKAWKQDGNHIFLKSGRVTFNAKGEPDMTYAFQTGGGAKMRFIRPNYNYDATKDGASIPDASVIDTRSDTGRNHGASFWRLGDCYNYLREMYMNNPPSDINHLKVDVTDGFITWPEAASDGTYFWLFTDTSGGTGGDVQQVVRDLAITGLSLADAIDQIIKRAGPYDWTLIPDSSTGGGGYMEIVAFAVNDAGGQAVGDINFEWGQVGDTVTGASPDVIGGSLTRTSRPRYNAAYAMGRKRVYEVTLSTVDGTLVKAWDDGTGSSEEKYLALVDAEDKDADTQLFESVFLRYQALEGMDWGGAGSFFNGGATTSDNFEAEDLDRPALKKLMSWAADPAAANYASRRLRVTPIVWRSTDSGTTWEQKPDNIGCTVLPDICGFRLGGGARKKSSDGSYTWGDNPWTWDGDTSTPAEYDLRITLAVEADVRIDATIDNSGSDRALEYFMDAAGGPFYWGARSKGILNTDNGNATDHGTPGTVVIDIPDGGGPAECGATVADVFRDDSTQLENNLDNRLAAREHGMIGGEIHLSGLRCSPTNYIGYRLAQLTATATGDRPTIEPNSCIRTLTISPEDDVTVITLDGR